MTVLMCAAAAVVICFGLFVYVSSQGTASAARNYTMQMGPVAEFRSSLVILQNSLEALDKALRQTLSESDLLAVASISEAGDTSRPAIRNYKAESKKLRQELQQALAAQYSAESGTGSPGRSAQAVSRELSRPRTRLATIDSTSALRHRMGAAGRAVKDPAAVDINDHWAKPIGKQAVKPYWKSTNLSRTDLCHPGLRVKVVAVRDMGSSLQGRPNRNSSRPIVMGYRIATPHSRR